MSLNYSLQCPHCKSDADMSINFTYNYGPMWYEAFGCFLGDFDQKTGEDTVLLLTKALVEMAKDPDRFKKHNPPNGWGKYEDFVEKIKLMQLYAIDHPDFFWKRY